MEYGTVLKICIKTLLFQACDENALTFREVQCKEHNTKELQWEPYDDEVPGMFS